MDQNEIELLIYSLQSLAKESEWVEFKLNNSHPQEIGEYISALSNGACYHSQQYGYLVFGIEDATHVLKGTSFKASEEKIGTQELENWLATQLTPRVDFQIFETTIQGKDVCIFRIDATYATPVKFKGQAYIRIGSIKKLLADHPERERKIWLKSNNQPFEKDIASKPVSGEQVLSLLDYESFFKMMDIQMPRTGAGVVSKLIENKLVIEHKSDFLVTNLGALLIAKDIKEFETISRKAIRVIFYKGNDRIITEKEVAKEIIGNKGYAIGFEPLITYLRDRLPSVESIDGPLRKVISVYPPLAIRELIANALIHQDFLITGASPLIEVFDDRIEITNPGKPLIDPLRFMDHSPQSRNELFAMAMRRLNICEERGTGIDKVVKQCEDFSLPAPEFINGDNYTRVILYSASRFKQMDKKDKIRTCYQHCCLLYISGEFMTNETVRARFQIDSKNYSIASRIISDTKEAGLVKETDPENKSRKYVPYWY